MPHFSWIVSISALNASKCGKRCFRSSPNLLRTGFKTSALEVQLGRVALQKLSSGGWVNNLRSSRRRSRIVALLSHNLANPTQFMARASQKQLEAKCSGNVGIDRQRTENCKQTMRSHSAWSKETNFNGYADNALPDLAQPEENGGPGSVGHEGVQDHHMGRRWLIKALRSIVWPYIMKSNNIRDNFNQERFHP